MTEVPKPKIGDPQNGKVLRKFGTFFDRTLPQADYTALMTETEKEVLAELETVKGRKVDPSFFQYVGFTDLTLALEVYYGDTLMDYSRQFSEEVERSWIFCCIEKQNWQDKTTQLHIKGQLRNGQWQNEPNKKILELLYNMDPQRQYMLYYAIYDEEIKKPLCFYAAVVTHGYIDDKDMVTRPIVLKMSGRKMHPMEFKWVCHGCLGAEKDRKLKLCAGCKSVRYCSVDCQRKSWRQAHPELCPILKKLRVQRETVDKKK